MCNKDLLVAYLYEDLPAADRAGFEQHLRDCPDCHRELQALRGVRVDLATWAPPLPDFGFRIIQNAPPAAVAAPVLTSPRWRTTWLPGFGLAAAAVLVLAASAAVAHVEVRHDAAGFSVRTGWNSAAPTQPAAPVPVVAKTAAPAVDPAVLTQIELRLNALETASHDAGVRQASALVRSSDTELMRRVKELMAESETRARGELALRMSQVIHDVDAQRIADLARIQQGLNHVDAVANQEAVAHRDFANYIMSQKQKQ